MSRFGRVLLIILLSFVAGGAGWWLNDHRELLQPLFASMGKGPSAPSDEETTSKDPDETAVEHKNGLGIGRDQLQAALSSPIPPRFIYHESPLLDGEPCLTGSLGDGKAVVELVGPAENLSQARLTVPLMMRGEQFEMPDAMYLVILARELAPGFSEASSWIEKSLPQTRDGAPMDMTRGQVRLRLSRLERFGLVTLEIAAADVR